MYCNRFLHATIGLWMLATGVLAQSAGHEIRGRVIDRDSGKGIADVLLLVQGTLHGATSDASGDFVITHVPQRERLDLVVKHLGYAEVTVTLNRQTDDLAAVRIELRPTILQTVNEVVVLAERSNDAFLQNVLRSNPDGGGRILRDLPGLHAVARGNVAYDPVIRGLKEEQVNVTIDGIKVEPACNGRMDPPTAYADLAELEALTIVKGPFEVTGLGSALGGTINLAKLRPVYRPGQEGVLFTGAVGGSFHSAASGDKESVRLGMSSSRVGLQLNLSRQAGDNYTSARREVPYSAYHDTHVDAMAGVRLAKNHEVRLAHYRSDGKDTGFPALPMDTRDHQALLYGLDYLAADAPLGISQFQLKAYRSEVSHLMDNLDRPEAMMREMSVLGETETTGGNAIAEWRQQRTTIKFGADAWQMFATARRDMLTKSTGMRMSSLIWPEVTMRSYAAFAEFSRVYGTAWSVTAGGRAARVESEAEAAPAEFLRFHQRSDSKASETNWDSFVRFNFDPQAAWSMSLALGRGVRPASHKERFGWYALNALDGYDYIGAPGLASEANWAANLSLQYRAEKFQIHAEPYFNRLQNYISGEVRSDLQPRSMGARGVKVYRNIGSARIYGVDVDLSWQGPARLRFFSNISFTNGRDLERDAPLPEIPPLSTLSGVRYVNPTNLFWVQVETRAAARQGQVSPFTGEDETAAFAVYHVRTGLRVGSRLQVQAGLENLTDVFYHEHLDRNNIPQAGRNFYLKTSIHF